MSILYRVSDQPVVSTSNDADKIVMDKNSPFDRTRVKTRQEDVFPCSTFQKCALRAGAAGKNASYTINASLGSFP